MSATVNIYASHVVGTGQTSSLKWLSRPEQDRRATARMSTFKRSMDILVSAVLLIMLLPLFSVVALAIKIDSRGPVFFRQKRVGYKGEHFKLWKHRSMYLDAEKRKQELLRRNDIEGNLLFKMKDDPRVTRVGRFIRKYSIDELPQLWNVLTGDMSLVGPRPAVPEEVARYSSQQRGRLLAVPGLTCFWQVGGRSAIPFEQQVQMDIDYIKNQSTWLDIKLLFLTVPAVLFAKGAC
jgi:exopolysaccharide biosynthesis polyprenyl glycosylphosphotransferase